MKRYLLSLSVAVVLGAGCARSSAVDRHPRPLPPPSPPVARPAAPDVPGASGPAAHADVIVIERPLAGAAIASPLTALGKARGTWYFEGSFPVQVVDADGEAVAMGVAHAQGDWMTADFVPFKAVLSFRTPKTETGTIIFRKDNPSGLRERDDELRVPVIFKTAMKAVQAL